MVVYINKNFSMSFFNKIDLLNKYIRDVEYGCAEYVLYKF